MFITQTPYIYEEPIYNSVSFGGWILFSYRYPYQRRIAQMELSLLSITIDTKTYDPERLCRPFNVYARTYKWYRRISGTTQAPHEHLSRANGCYMLDLSDKDIQFTDKTPTTKITLWEKFLKSFKCLNH